MEKSKVSVAVQRGIKFEPVVYEGFGVNRLDVAELKDVAKAMEVKFSFEVAIHKAKVEALATAYTHMPLSIVCNALWLQFVAGTHAFNLSCEAQKAAKPVTPSCSSLEAIYREFDTGMVGVWGTRQFVSAAVPHDGWKGFAAREIQRGFYGLPVYTADCSESRHREEQMLWSGVAEVEVDYEGRVVEDGFYQFESDVYSDEGYHVEDSEYTGDEFQYAQDAAQDKALYDILRNKRRQAAFDAMLGELAKDETEVNSPMDVVKLSDEQVMVREGLRLAKEKGKLVNPAALWSNTRKNLRK